MQSPQPSPPNQVVMMGGNQKSVGAAFLLTFFFGPLGLFYASVVGGCIMLFGGVILIAVTLGLGLPIVWIGSIIWAVIAVNQHNDDNMRQAQNIVNTQNFVTSQTVYQQPVPQAQTPIIEQKHHVNPTSNPPKPVLESSAGKILPSDFKNNIDDLQGILKAMTNYFNLHSNVNEIQNHIPAITQFASGVDEVDKMLTEEEVKKIGFKYTLNHYIESFSQIEGFIADKELVGDFKEITSNLKDILNNKPASSNSKIPINLEKTAMEVLLCNKCNVPYEINDKYCESCGNKLR